MCFLRLVSIVCLCLLAESLKFRVKFKVRLLNLRSMLTYVWRIGQSVVQLHPGKVPRPVTLSFKVGGRLAFPGPLDKSCWCSADNEKWNDPYKPSNWWFIPTHSLPFAPRSVRLEAYPFRPGFRGRTLVVPEECRSRRKGRGGRKPIPPSSEHGGLGRTPLQDWVPFRENFRASLRESLAFVCSRERGLTGLQKSWTPGRGQKAEADRTWL